MSEVAFICVAYETLQHLRSFAEQILQGSTASRVQLLVVDNSAKADATLAEKLQSRPRARYFHTGQNLGYFGGARFALERLREQGDLPDWIVVCNVDLRFAVDEFVASLVRLESYPSVGAVAPRLVSQATGQNMNPFFRFRPSSSRMGFYCVVFKFYPVLQFYHWLGHWYHTLGTKLRRTRPAAAAPSLAVEEVYAPHGALFALSREYFRRGGTLEHGAFLFGEEITIAERVQELGLKTVFDPSCRIDHLDSASTAHVRSRRIAKYMHEAATFCFASYFGKRRSGG